MRQSILAILSGTVLVVLLAMSWCGRKSQPEYTGVPPATATPAASTPALSPTATSTVPRTGAQSPAPEMRKLIERVGPAVILISVFDEPGKLLRTATGFFISQDGRFVANRNAFADAAHAVAKTSEGRIYNVAGMLSDAEALDLAVFQADVKKPVPFLASSKAAGAAPGARVAAIASPLIRGAPPLFAATVSATKADDKGERLELAAPPPNELTGAPVVNENGELLGVVTSPGGQPRGPNIVRSAATLDLVVAKIPGDAKPQWRAATNVASGPSPLPGQEQAGAVAPDVPVKPGTKSGPSARGQKSRIIYNPKPPYPAYSYFKDQGTGRFRITFSANGTVKSVQVIQSTKSATLDNVTLEALRRWRATPGQEWNVTVPVTFQRR